MFRRVLILPVLLMVLLTDAQGCAMGTKSPELLTVTGTIRVVGNEPYTRVVLTPEDGRSDYLLLGPLQDELRTCKQGHTVTLQGKECLSPAPQFVHCLEPVRVVEE